MGDKRKFAKEQYDFLKEHGIDNRMRLSRIFKAAGPGQIKEAYNLATCEDWNTDVGKVRKDLLECLLSGAGCVRWGKKRFENVLSSLGFPIPKAPSSKCFFRILDGALEILAPGSYEFTDKELLDIKSGLKKKVYENGKEA